MNGSAPLALQLAVRVERDEPPTAAQAAVAAAIATVALLDDERSQPPDGPWADAVAAWDGARIRKIVRRARGSAWRKAQEVDGVTVTVDGVEARAFVPGPIDDVPRPVAKLQIQSTPLAEAEPVSELPDRPTGDGDGDVGSSGPVLLVAVTPEVEMSWGKRAAQCAHAAHRAWTRADDDLRAAWTAAGRPIEIVHPDAGLWSRLVVDADVEIRDGGFTEIPAGTRTTVARWLGVDPPPATDEAGRRATPSSLLARGRRRFGLGRGRR